MRTLKFRCYDKVNKEFVSLAYGTSLTTSELEARDKGDQYEITQWTGLTDKVGVEIYEGDVVRWQSERLEVIEFPFIDEDIHTTEVIGNIHENPELLEAQS